MEIAIAAVVGVFLGVVVGYFLLSKALNSKRDGVLKEAEKEGDAIKKDKILQAKEKFLQLKEEHEKSINNRDRKMNERENKIRQKEKSLNQKSEDYNRKDKEVKNIKNNLDRQVEIVSKKQAELNKAHEKHVEELEKLSGYSIEEAKAQLVENLKDEARTNAMSYIQDIQEEAKLNANKEAKKIVIQSIQRVAAETAIENSVSVLQYRER